MAVGGDLAVGLVQELFDSDGRVPSQIRDYVAICIHRQADLRMT